MNGKNLYDQFSRGSASTRLAVIAAVVAWGLLFLTILAWAFFSLESRSQAQEPTVATPTAVIAVTTPTGSTGSEIGGQVITSTEATVVLPTVTETPTVAPTPTTVEATVSSDSEILPLPATATPTPSPVPAGSLSETIPLPTEAPTSPALNSVTNLNVRSGPGTVYPVVGALQTGQNAEVTGLSYDRGWWQIRFPGAVNGYGWVSAQYVTAQNVSNIPLVQAPPAPVAPAPTPVPAPVVQAPIYSVSPSYGIWHAEYYNNLSLSGSPVLVRDEGDINYNWGTGSPAPGVSADNFSARWTGIWSFGEGTYRFHASVDDGVRLYVDGVLVLDNWQDGGQREIVADRWLSGGNHTIRVEYYEHQVQAVIRVWTELIGSSVPVSGSSNDNNNDEPRADFSVDDRSGSAPLRVKFDNDSTGDYDECDWDFGDGHGSDDCDDVRHTYDHPGTYTVQLKIDGPDGDDSERKSDYIRVGEEDNQPPQVPADWHDVLPSDWKTKVPEKFHGAIEACVDHFNQIKKPLESPVNVDRLMKDCADFLK